MNYLSALNMFYQDKSDNPTKDLETSIYHYATACVGLERLAGIDRAIRHTRKYHGLFDYLEKNITNLVITKSDSEL
ncbi:hypothetical protein GF327_09205 [Candidatus Woesearchaeota archaeon]|nr:hypothetical protein [Candidatus Woesearchaeota archaeon]